mmetsp:Transcript_43510/g.41983  ORF Transcript_43510/g.41983 Transcript_43510/m.41983 type:complete len:203 (+) Transcript_43510:870-1478(+)
MAAFVVLDQVVLHQARALVLIRLALLSLEVRKVPLNLRLLDPRQLVRILHIVDLLGGVLVFGNGVVVVVPDLLLDLLLQANVLQVQIAQVAALTLLLRLVRLQYVSVVVVVVGFEVAGLLADLHGVLEELAVELVGAFADLLDVLVQVHPLLLLAQIQQPPQIMGSHLELLVVLLRDAVVQRWELELLIELQPLQLLTQVLQ